MSESSGAPTPPEEPSRYRRSANGLAASLIVTVLVVVAFVGFRAIFRDQPEVGPEPVDYLETVAAAQGADLTLVYPRELPAGWIATSVHFEPGEHPAWGIGMLTEDGHYVGVRQETEDVEDLLATYVDEDAKRGNEVELDSGVASTWTTWSDAGGDLAYSAEAGTTDSETILVYGSASAGDQEELIGTLTTERL